MSEAKLCDLCGKVVKKSNPGEQPSLISGILGSKLESDYGIKTKRLKETRIYDLCDKCFDKVEKVLKK